MDTPKNSIARFALVTGTSTGIGKATSLRLAAEGVNVFAGVRRSTDGDALLTEASRISERASGKKGRMIPVILPDQSVIFVRGTMGCLLDWNVTHWTHEGHHHPRAT
jgi:NAD(P)-dependent dehydrogenase (short-subunit alcohol dehydrogenase family)